MSSFETAVFVIFVFACLAGIAIKKVVSKASENPAVKEKATEVGLRLLSKWFGGK